VSVQKYEHALTTFPGGVNGGAVGDKAMCTFRIPTVDCFTYWSY